jgi:hypothetical protein
MSLIRVGNLKFHEMQFAAPMHFNATHGKDDFLSKLFKSSSGENLEEETILFRRHTIWLSRGEFATTI